jgi:hypothetical protein
MPSFTHNTHTYFLSQSVTILLWLASKSQYFCLNLPSSWGYQKVPPHPAWDHCSLIKKSYWVLTDVVKYYCFFLNSHSNKLKVPSEISE